jgi:hypothetical protein
VSDEGEQARDVVRRATRREHHELRVVGVVGELLPGGELPIADLEQPPGRNRTDNGFWRATKEAAAVGAGNCELDHEIGLDDPGVAPPGRGIRQYADS